MRDLVYISYSHADRETHRKLRRVLDGDPRIADLIWDDTKLTPGEDWRQEIDQHVARARIMIMLVSENYLSQGNGGLKRCSAWDCEIEQAFKGCEAGELTILWLPVTSASVVDTPFEKRTAAHDLSRPLDSLNETEQQTAYDNLRELIHRIIDNSRSFDVFLSHNSNDKPTVRVLADGLEQRGISVWLDERQLIAGQPWQIALEDAIQSSRSAAVIVGGDGMGPWEVPEMRACLSEFVKRKMPVIPVLLPSASVEPELPLFLSGFMWVDMRHGITDAELDRIADGVRAAGSIAGGNPARKRESVRLELENSLPQFKGKETAIQDAIEKFLKMDSRDIKFNSVKSSSLGSGCCVRVELPRTEAARLRKAVEQNDPELIRVLTEHKLTLRRSSVPPIDANTAGMEDVNAGRSSSPRIMDPAVPLTAWQMLFLFVFCAFLSLATFSFDRGMAYVFTSITAAIGLFGFLGGIARVESRLGKFGGGAAAFIATLSMLFGFAGNSTVDLNGTVFLDGQPVQNARVFLLDIERADNLFTIAPSHQGGFSFRGVSAVKGTVRLNIDIDGPDDFEPYVIEQTFKANERLDIKLHAEDLTTASVSPNAVTAYLPRVEIAEGRTVNGAQFWIDLVDRAESDPQNGKNLQPVNSSLKVLNDGMKDLPADWNSQVYVFESKSFEQATVKCKIRSSDLPRTTLTGTRVESFVVGTGAARYLPSSTVSNNNEIIVDVPVCPAGARVLVLVWAWSENVTLPPSGNLKFTVQQE